MAGKALKDVNNLNKCSACGNVKRAHLLCPYCVRGKGIASVAPKALLILLLEIRDMWSGRSRLKESDAETKAVES